MKKKACPCPADGSSLFSGQGFSRRHFLRIGGTALVASWFGDVLAPQILHGATAATVPLRKTARSCIFIFLSGGPSHVDMWDLKEGSWTPSDFAPATYGDIRWPQGLMPRTAEHLGKLAIIRSGLAWAAVHPLAQKWAQISRNPSSATGGFAPHIGAVVSLEAQLTRTPADVLPGFVALGTTMAGAGYLSPQHAPFSVMPNQQGLAALSHPDGAQRLDERWKLLESIDNARLDGSLGRDASGMASFYDQAKLLIDTPGVNQIFTYNAEERTRYGSTNFGDSLIVARNLVASNRGTRFVHVTFGGWDHHDNIYNRAANNSLYTQCRTLDNGLSALLQDLSATPGARGGMLLDETLVLVLGEFGRTPGLLRGGGETGGRDHFLRMSVVAAGGGVRGGRVIGVTDALGDRVVEYGWRAGRDVRPEDLTATIYSALGIDYTTVRPDDPLGRGFEYVPYANLGLYEAVDEMWG